MLAYKKKKKKLTQQFASVLLSYDSFKWIYIKPTIYIELDEHIFKLIN